MFWLLLALSRVAIAASNEIKFDYLGALNGEAQIKATCSVTKDRKLNCQFTEVRTFPLDEDMRERVAVHSALAPYQKEKDKTRTALQRIQRIDPLDYDEAELKAFWRVWYAEQLKKDPDQLERLKKKECTRDPRDYFELRGAYNETYDDFLDEAKAIQDRLCKAKGPKDYIAALEKRWELNHVTCQLDYSEYSLTLDLVSENRWAVSGATEGAHLLTQCFQKMKTSLECPPNKDCRLTREYSQRIVKEKSKFRPSQPDRCPDFSDRLDLSSDLKSRRPIACKFFLDRLRASHCCAFGN